ncbi:MAG: IS4 family transposase [Gemmatimonadetes bacterium]|nr:IS4 family transposase [Gemmatimonadota bacterium]
MALLRRTSLGVLFATLDREAVLRQRVRTLGVVRRQGKIDLYAMLCVVVLGVAVRGPVAIAQLGHIMAEVTGVVVARSSFWDRISPAFAKLVRSVLDDVVVANRARVVAPPGVLSGFADVFAVDATVVKLHDDLAHLWRGTRRNSARAALKVHTWIRAFTGEIVKYRVTQDAHGDGRAFGIDQALRGVLVLFDKGYSSPSLWRRIDHVGGYFLTRLPRDRAPTITGENRRHRGRARKVVGRGLRDVLEGLQRSVLDVEAPFRCCVRKYGSSKNRWVEHPFRLVAIRDRRGHYEVFVTNAPPELLPAEAVARTYRLRWEVETFFRTAKTGSGLRELPSAKAHIVETLVYAALLRATTSMQALAKFRRETADALGLLVNPGQWHTWWNRTIAGALAELVLSGEHLRDHELARLLADPNRGRPTNRSTFSVCAYA